MSLIGGQIFPIELFGLEFEVCEQGLALFSLVPIWLYSGRQGHHSKAIQYACYAFYPVHMLILGLIQLSLLQNTKIALKKGGACSRPFFGTFTICLLTLEWKQL